eukprot:1159373-Pelagomonas_calceolata.AAC.9
MQYPMHSSQQQRHSNHHMRVATCAWYSTRMAAKCNTLCTHHSCSIPYSSCALPRLLGTRQRCLRIAAPFAFVTNCSCAPITTCALPRLLHTRGGCFVLQTCFPYSKRVWPSATRYTGDVSAWGRRRVSDFYDNKSVSESNFTMSSGLSPRDTRPREREFDIEAAKKALCAYSERYYCIKSVLPVAPVRQASLLSCVMDRCIVCAFFMGCLASQCTEAPCAS